MRRWAGAFWVGLWLAALSGAAFAQTPVLRPLGPDELVVFLKLLRADPKGGLSAVPLDHQFAASDRFVVEVTLSRGGYVALAKLGAGNRPEKRVWPREAAGHPMSSQSAVRLPPVGSFQLSGSGPTRLALLVSPTPLAAAQKQAPAGVTPPPPTPVQRWLQQIRLRDVVVNEQPLPVEPLATFQGVLRPRETAGIRLELRHPGGTP